MDRDKKIEMLRQMILIRRFEEKVKELYNRGLIVGAIHLYIGQEAVAVGVCQALREDDYIFSTHRGHGHAIAKTGDVEKIMAELMGKETGLSRGHGGSMHLFEPEKGLMGGNGVVGAGIPLSLGAAFSSQYMKLDRVSVSFFSDGAANQGTFGESLNLAALWKLPVLFVCENNQYAATTPVRLSTALPDIGGRARSYGVNAECVDGNDVLAVYNSASKAVERIRVGEGPFLIECITYRIEPHCGILPDDREPGERERWMEKDPILVLCKKLEKKNLISAAQINAIEKEIINRIQAAVEFAQKSPWPDLTTTFHKTWMVQQ
jgi:TPP-dependent pyruvate/acetoin dehydrogenase alpha subunit